MVFYLDIVVFQDVSICHYYIQSFNVEYIL